MNEKIKIEKHPRTIFFQETNIDDAQRERERERERDDDRRYDDSTQAGDEFGSKMVLSRRSYRLFGLKGGHKLFPVT